MGGWVRRVRTGLAVATAVAAVSVGFLATHAPTAEAAECFERYVGAPINEKDDKYQATPLGWAEHGKQSEAAARQ